MSAQHSAPLEITDAEATSEQLAILDAASCLHDSRAEILRDTAAYISSLHPELDADILQHGIPVIGAPKPSRPSGVNYPTVKRAYLLVEILRHSLILHRMNEGMSIAQATGTTPGRTYLSSAARTDRRRGTPKVRHLHLPAKEMDTKMEPIDHAVLIYEHGLAYHLSTPGFPVHCHALPDERNLSQEWIACFSAEEVFEIVKRAIWDSYNGLPPSAPVGVYLPDILTMHTNFTQEQLVELDEIAVSEVPTSRLFYMKEMFTMLLRDALAESWAKASDNTAQADLVRALRNTAPDLPLADLVAATC